MGACNSKEVIAPSSYSSKQQRAKMLSILILKNCTIGKELLGMLSGISYTNSRAQELSKALIGGLIHLQRQEPAECLWAIKELFNKQTTELIKGGNLLYIGALNKLKQNNVSHDSKSRIYHTIANLKKQTKVEEKNKNQYGVQCIKNNDYKYLNEPELKQIVKYESIAEKTREIGQKIRFKLQSIRKQSQDIVELLTECLKKHISVMVQLKYDLSEIQVMKMAQISRQACNFFDNGVFVLLVYFVNSCTRLEGQQRSPNQIQQLLQRAIKIISKLYPPGFGLSSEHQELIRTLKELYNPNSYKKVDFIHQEIALNSANAKKQMQVDQIIMKYAIIAEQQKEIFEELIMRTCLSKCVYFKIGLKYYPKHPNTKALTRIKQKMFFKKGSNEDKKINQSKIKQVLDREQSEYKSKIDEILERTEKVLFKITDMVRGKCVFLDIADIIFSVNQIKKFVSKDSRFAIAQIQSRFTNKIPISDVTLKIILNNKIVAELQLTVQTNSAIYNFAHKVYQLERTKVFSKLKIVHNYFQEFKGEFHQLAQNALQLQFTKSNISSQAIKEISAYFQLKSSSKPFAEILYTVMQETQTQIKKWQVSTDPQLQDLICVAFNLGLGKWGKEVGRKVNKAIKNENLSPQLKSVILSIFFDKLHLPTQSQNMQQYGYLQQQLKEKIYMQQFMRQYFQIDEAFKYINQSQRIWHRASQLKQVVFYKQYQSHPIQLKQTPFISNLVVQSQSSQTIQQLREIFNFYFVTKKENNQVYDQFGKYLKWLETQIVGLQNRDQTQLLSYQVKVIKALYQIENNNPYQAQQYLQNSLKYFKQKQDHKKVMDCQILLAECKVKTEDHSLKEKDDYYKKNVLQKAQILGLSLKGTLYADSLRRVQQYLWDQHSEQNEKKQLLLSFTKRALQQLSRSKGKQFIYAALKRWPEYQRNHIQIPKIMANSHLRYAKLNNIQAIGCRYLSKAGWKNIISLNLYSNHIGSQGCEYLKKADWKYLSQLYLRSNYIGDEGCQHLSQADWKNMKKINLWDNNIGPEGCEHLKKANWKNLTVLNLNENDIRAEGCQELTKADWKKINSLDLRSNSIGAAGCQHLIKADWKNITSLNLYDNNIGATGCEFLSQAIWIHMTNLNLCYNNIGAQGCENLCKSDWRNLKQLYLYENGIGALGCEHLSKGDWKNIVMLNLSDNNIGAAGCHHLCKAKWENIQSINLRGNNVEDAGCKDLSKADWRNLKSINLWKNNIGVAGCEYLTKAKWGQLKQLQIGGNNIEDKQSFKNSFTQKGIRIYM